jgi:hypothetical protein
MRRSWLGLVAVAVMAGGIATGGCGKSEDDASSTLAAVGTQREIRR